MKIPRYWAKGTAQAVDDRGKPVSFSCWGWSDAGPEDAGRQGRSRAEQILTRLGSGERLNKYSYGTRPMREEIVEAVTASGHKEVGLVTRNGYGSLVLNAAGAMFIDLDFPGGSDSPPGFLARLLGRKRPSAEDRRLKEVEAWAERHREFDLRVYRTRAGLRAIITNEVFDPTQPAVEALMRELNSDPLYIKLCRQQECFRARLTPKHWRCQVPRPPFRWPFASSREEQAARQWEQSYEQATRDYTVCRELANIGDCRVHPEVAPILALHDKYCCKGEGLTLA
jgi:hypothetical protein